MTQRKPKTRKHARKGTAVAELAVCLPAIALLVLGALECTTMTFVRQSLHITAYEGVRVAIRDDTTTSDVRDRCQRILTERTINGALVAISPGTTESVPRGTEISVEVSAPCDSNNVLPLRFFSGNTLVGAAAMIKE